MMIGIIFVMFFAQNIEMLFVGEILCGLVCFTASITGCFYENIHLG